MAMTRTYLKVLEREALQPENSHSAAGNWAGERRGQDWRKGGWHVWSSWESVGTGSWPLSPMPKHHDTDKITPPPPITTKNDGLRRNHGEAAESARVANPTNDMT